MLAKRVMCQLHMTSNSSSSSNFVLSNCRYITTYITGYITKLYKRLEIPYVTNRRLNTSNSSERATGGSTVYQVNSRQVSKGNTVCTIVRVSEGMNVLWEKDSSTIVNRE